VVVDASVQSDLHGMSPGFTGSARFGQIQNSLSGSGFSGGGGNRLI